nr:hypothetical protein [Corynebacterium diphtheriae]
MSPTSVVDEHKLSSGVQAEPTLGDTIVSEVPQVLFRLSRWENLRTCQGKFDQAAKNRVVRLIEDRILADYVSMQLACKIVAPKLGVSWHTARQ